MHSIAQAQSLEDCKFVNKDSVSAGFQTTGFVSLQGHYASELDLSLINYPYALVCDDRLVLDRADRASTFNFSDPTSVVATDDGNDVYGGGHITTTGVGVNFQTEAYHGFTEGACEVKHVNEGCGDDVCVLKTSNPDQGTVADCRDGINRPYQNLFQYKICCTPKEYCRDGIDNTGDALIDCASPDCHPSANNLDIPQQCAPGPAPNNNQSTADCIESTSFDIDGNALTTYKPHCTYTQPGPFGVEEYYYCNYGFEDNSSIEPNGFCCPVGQWYDSSLTPPRCRDFLKCGISSGFMCEHSFFNSKSQWLNELFDGSSFNWCHSRLPLFTNEASSILRSEACCPIVHQGKFDYFIVDSNVKIFGAE